MGWLSNSGSPPDGPAPASEVWETGRHTAQGFAVLHWIDEVPSGRTHGGMLNSLELWSALAIVAAGVLIGAYYGGGDGALAGLFIALVFAPAVFRRSTLPTLQNIGGYMPGLSSWGTRAATAAEERQEALPMLRTDKVQAYIWRDDAADEEYFCVSVDEGGKGGVHVRVFEPWLAVEEIREANYNENFESKANLPRNPDTHTIIMHTAAGTQLIAETVHGRAHLDGLTFALQDMVLTQRDEYYREKKRRALDGGRVGPSIPDQL